MDDENEYKKLPTEEKCVHKLWKARVAGYEEAVKLFNQMDEKSPDWNKYIGLIKKFVIDSNAVAQEKGMEAALVFVENCFQSGKTTGDVMAGIVAKCIAAPKTKTKDLALQITLMYVEIEKQDIVQEELIKGMDHKNPKVVAACVSALTTALKQYGNKVITIKPMVKKISVLLTDRDKGVRDEGKALVVEMHRWIGPAIEPHIASLQAVMQQELREAFGCSGTAQPIRYLRSQQTKMADVPDSANEVDGSVDDDDDKIAGADSGELDPYELFDPVEILSKIPKEFYEKLEATKWQERKEALDILENLLKSAQKLEPGDYAELVRALKKVISKDTNVMLVALAGRLLGLVANGLRSKFQPYAVACIQAILEKFKEKKANVVTAMRDAIDAIFPSTNLEAILDDMLEAFNNKNPAVKSETAWFLARALCKTQPAAFNKKMIKAYIPALMKLLESAEPIVRDAAAEALGTAIKLVGEKNIAPHIGKIDNLKEQKIKEFADKAVIQVKVVASKKEKSKVTAGKGDGGKAQAGSSQPKPVKRPVAAKKSTTSVTKKASGRIQSTLPREQELNQEEVDQKSEELLSSEVISNLGDGNWKSRLEAVQSFQSSVKGFTPGDASSQLLFRIINKKPGLKETNVQVLKARLELVKHVSENFPISTTAADVVLHDVVHKLGEANCNSLSHECLTALAEASNLEHVVNEGLNFAMDLQKNPKVQSEFFNWLSNAVKEFGFTINIKPLIVYVKKAISATNPNVRTSAVNFLGIVSLYVGPSLINHFDTEKPATRQLISLELDKCANNLPPAPTRGVSKSASKASFGDDDELYEDAVYEEVIPADDARPRTDLAPLMTESLISEINDKNWKVRNEALEKLKNIITSSSPLKSSLGELPLALTARLLDANSKLAQTALQICECLAIAMGSKCKIHVRTFFPHFFQAFGDSKQYIRSASTSCVDVWCREAGGTHVAFEGEMIYDALKGGSPLLRAELFQWLTDQLPNAAPKSFSRDELLLCIPVLYACIEDRSVEVRKRAADCVLPIMLHLGYEVMHKQMDKLKPGSKTVVLGMLDKARPNLPVQPLPSKKKDDPRSVKSAGALKKEGEKKSSAVATKSKGTAKQNSTNRSKNDEEFTPLLPNNNAKHQRIIDDQKLKVLKWNFTTPREEFFDLLKEQMTSAGVNKQLIANMFHSDFRYHLKAIESLSEDLHENPSALISNLDLVLKWLTLRFFDTNPSVILKGLEYVSAVFNILIEHDYSMAEYEANCFIPYLVLKVGDPKDTVRNGVKALFKQICVVYSVTKLFGYLMEGLKSKNARQRAECLECIGHLLETYGSTAMSPAIGAALKELARHIGDRDNAVRSAALNCVANAYFLEGEKVYKMIGQISDKDLSLLEERIKRAGKTKSAESRRSMVVPLSASGRPISQAPSESTIEEAESPRHVISVDIPVGVDYEDDIIEEPPIPVRTMAPPEPRVIKGPFGLDPNLIAELDAQVPQVTKSELPELDLKFLDEPVTKPNIRSNIPLSAPRGNVIPMSPPRRIMSTHSLITQSPQAPAVEDSQLANTIHAISSPDLAAAIRSLSLLLGAMESGRGTVLAGHEERLVQALTSQIKQLRTGRHPSHESFIAFKYISNTLTWFYEHSGCAGAVNADALTGLLTEILRVLGGAPGPCGGIFEGSEGERLVRVLNNVCVRVLEHSDHTALLCALLGMLDTTISANDTSYPRFQELMIKCLWKTLKMLNTWDANSLDYDSVMYKIHLFYKAYPNSYWKKNSDMSNTPYRTIKTLVHTLVKLKGSSIVNHLTQIPDSQETELYTYLQKVIKQLKLDDKKENIDNVNGTSAIQPTPNTALNAGRLPRAVHDELSLILKRIGNKEHNREALGQLYDLHEQHPNVDIWTFMQGSSFYFRNYVERGLREIAEQRRLGNHPVYRHADYNTDNMDVSNENDEKTHVVFLERLRALQAKAGLKTDSAPSSQPRTPIIDNKALNESITDSTLTRTHSIDPQLELHSMQPVSQRNEPGMDAIRLKLQQIKSSSKR